MPSNARRLASLCWLAPILALTPLAASAKTPAETPAQIIERQENAYSQTFVTGDRAIADRLLADDFVGLNSSGKAYDRTSILADIARPPHQTSAHIDSIRVQVHGDVAIALGTETDTGPSKDEVDHRIWLDTWKQTAKGWKLIASSEMAPPQK